MPRALRIYAETLPYERVIEPATLRLLVRHPLELVLAVRPWDVPHLPAVARVLEDAGVPLTVWPMLGDEDGRWASVGNAPAFARFLREITAALEGAGALPREVLLDLEPPFAAARALSRGALLRPAVRLAEPGARFEEAASALAASVSELHARGVATSSAVWPMVALDAPGERGWQAALGTPVDALGARRVTVMLYTSLLEGWSRGLVRRRHSEQLLAAACARTVRRWGDAAGVSLGCVGTGALEDEPVYRDPGELAVDVAVARAEGCEDLTLFELGGVLARPPPEAWLDAFAFGGAEGQTSDARSGARASARVGAARVALRALTWALARRR